MASTVLGGAGEAEEDAEDREEGEGEEGEEDVDEAGRIGAMIGVQVGLHGVIEREGAALRAEPVGLVGKIDDFGGHGTNDGREAEGDEGGDDGGAEEEEKEYGLGLPTVGHSFSIEMRLHDVG